MREFWLVVAAIAVAAPCRVGAEGLLDLYVGGAFTEESDLDFETSVFGNFSARARWDDSIAGGVRSGYWLEGRAKWIGIGGDVSYFQADVSSVFSPSSGSFVPAGGTATFHLLPISPLLMVRFPLLSNDEFEHGRLQPYAAIGPGFFLSILTSDSTPAAEAGFDVGLDARVGVTTLLTPRFGLFIEYRRTDVDVEITDENNDKVKSSLKTNHVNGGIALRF